LALAGIRVSGEPFPALSALLGALLVLRGARKSDGIRLRGHQVTNWLYRLADAARDRGRRRFWTADLASGRRAEDLAHRFLRRRGMTIVARNYRPPFGGGEIDLIAWHGDRLVFVEVKSRATGEFGAPERA